MSRSQLSPLLKPLTHRILLFAAAFLVASVAFTQAPAAKTDTLIFINGEQLTGELERADGTGITFKSPMAGEITVKWANVKELRSDKNFAVLPSNEKLTRKNAGAAVPQGSISVADKTISVSTSSGPRSLPIENANRIVSAAAFDRAVNHPPDILHGWTGAFNLGASLVRATQSSTTFTGAVNLQRAMPQVDWLPARSRTLLNYNQAYGTTSQAPQPEIKTNIFHADAERDQYFSPRVFAFGEASFDHNFSQALELQQQYGGGLGVTVIRNAVQQLDLKGDVHYEKQQFFNPVQNQNLFGSTFSDTYLRHLPGKIVFTQNGSVSPSWNNTDAYSAHAAANLNFPVFRGFSFFVGAVDDYLNNAPAGFRKNSVQYSSGISYAFR